jgi:cyanophycinase
MTNNAELSPRRGWLALIGGGEDKSRDCHVLRRIVAVNNARRMVIIPTASRIGDEVGADYDRLFAALGVPHRRVLAIKQANQADDPAALAAVAAADLIFFTGGDQVRLVEVLRGSPLIAAVRRRLEDGATVAGTSAGASAAGQHMLWDGDGRGFHKGTIGSGPGFGLIPGLCIDTHFLSRSRLPRLTQLLCQGRVAAGVGLSEDTALLIAPDGIASVIGSDMVTLLHQGEVGQCDFAGTGEGERFSVDGVRLSFLAPGSRFDLRAWRAVPSPQDSVAPRHGDKKATVLM